MARTVKATLNVLVLSAILAIPAILSACNTTEGFGKDVKAAGNGIENAADRAKPD